MQVTRATRSLTHECQGLRPKFYPRALFSHRKRRIQSRNRPRKGPSLARSLLSGKPLSPETLSHQNFVVPQRAATVPTPRTYCSGSLSPACHRAYLTLNTPDYSPGQNHIFPTEEDYGKGAKIQRGQGRKCGFLRKTPALNSTPDSALSPEVSKIQTSSYPSPSMPTPGQESRLTVPSLKARGGIGAVHATNNRSDTD